MTNVKYSIVLCKSNLTIIHLIYCKAKFTFTSLLNLPRDSFDQIECNIDY